MLSTNILSKMITLKFFPPFKLGGVIAEVNLAEHSTVITFSDYHEGAATFLLINHTKSDPVQYNQR